MRERSGGGTGCNILLAAAAGCAEEGDALFSERHALEASDTIISITATPVRRVMWITRVVPSYKKTRL